MGNEFSKLKKNRFRKTPDLQQEKAKRRETAVPNSLIMRVMEDPDAEREANRLSAGVTSTTPDELMNEMGTRLGADFSGVQFHTDPLSMKRSQAMGARAWAQGSDVYFGKGGFEPSVAAHELVHTIQQGAVQGNVSQSMPLGAVQLLPKSEEDDDNVINRPPNNVSNIELMMQQYNSGNLGRSLFESLGKPVKKLAEKSGNRTRRTPNAQSSMQYISILGERDYSGKEILKSIAAKGLDNKDMMYEREDEYEGFLDYIEQRTDKPALEAAGYDSGIFTGAPKHQLPQNNQANKRAYELSAEEIKNGQFNPQNDASVKDGLDAIDKAETAKDAYLAFVQYTGTQVTQRERMNNAYYVNMARTLKYETPEVNVGPLKAKLKNMVRQIRDYPELRKKIGAMTIKWTEADEEGNDFWGKKTSESTMSAATTAGLDEKVIFTYDAYLDRAGNEEEREKINENMSIGSLDNLGNHELGHALGATLDDEYEDHHRHVSEDSILKSALGKVMPGQQIPLLQADGRNKYNQPVFKGHVNTTDDFLEGHTSSYGQSHPSELFAEAFHDVYTKGSDAKPLSIEIVKEYERRQAAKQVAGFRKKKQGFFRNVGRFFGRLINFRNRPNRQNLITQLDAPKEEVNPFLDEDVPEPDMVVERPKRRKLKSRKKKKQSV